MKLKNILFGAFGLLLISGCSTIRVDSDYARGSEFSSLKTYAWASDSQPKTGDLRIDNTLIDSRVRSAVDETLAAGGYQKISSGTPDFLVVYRLSIEGKLDVTTIEAPVVAPNIQYGRLSIPAMGYSQYYGDQTFVTEYEEGTLLIDFVDPSSQKLMWRGSAKGTVKEKAKPEQREARIREAVSKILAQFPPQ